MKWRGLLFVVLLFCFGLSTQSIYADEISPSKSIIQIEKKDIVKPGDNISLNIGLKQGNGEALKTVPKSGKVFLWATKENGEVAKTFSVVENSTTKSLYLHGSGEEGVYIMDARQMLKSISFDVRFDEPGKYEVHGLFLPQAEGFKIKQAKLFWPNFISGGNEKGREVIVRSDKVTNFGFMVANISLRRHIMEPVLIKSPFEDNFPKTEIPIDKFGQSPTILELIFYKNNGRSIGANTQISLKIHAENVRAREATLLTDEDGAVRFELDGMAKEGDYLEILADGKSIGGRISLMPYLYRPKEITLPIGSNWATVDGKKVKLETPALIRGGRTYIPYRALSEMLDAEIFYEPSARAITTYYNNHILTMTLDTAVYVSDRQTKKMDAKPFVVAPGYTMVPIRFIAEELGFEVEAKMGSKGVTSVILRDAEKKEPIKEETSVKPFVNDSGKKPQEDSNDEPLAVVTPGGLG